MEIKKLGVQPPNKLHPTCLVEGYAGRQTLHPDIGRSISLSVCLRVDGPSLESCGRISRFDTFCKQNQDLTLSETISGSDPFDYRQEGRR